MRNKIILIFTAFVLILLFSGCQLIKRDRIDPDSPEKTDYRKGTSALSMKFLANFPRDEVKEGREFGVMIEVANQGAYDINGLDLSLTGLIDDITEVISEPEIIRELTGRSLGFPEGDREIVDWKLKNIKRLSRDKHSELIKIKACYEYRTIASAEICVNPSTELVAAPEVCRGDQRISLSGGQGAPIAVTRVEQQTTPIDTERGLYEIELIIFISNLGGGIVYGETGCNSGGIVEVEDISFSEKSLGLGIDCEFEDSESLNRDIILDEKNKELKCTAQIDTTRGSFETPLIIKLSYWYENEVQKIVEIVK